MARRQSLEAGGASGAARMLSVVLAGCFVLSTCPRAAAAEQSGRTQKSTTFFVSPTGADTFSGRLADVNAERTDGPFATIGRARDAVRRLKGARKLTAPANVLLRGGTYYLDETLVFTPADSGAPDCPVTYAAYRDEQPVLSGGRPIRQWRRGDGGRWVTDVPGTREGNRRFDQLFVGGQRRYRARLPKQGFYRVAGGAGTVRTADGRRVSRFAFAPGDIRADWTNLNDVEAVVVHFWVDARLPIAAVDAENRTVMFARRCARRLTDDFTSKGARYYVDNVFEALTEPGQWYLDRSSGRLHYLPKPGEEMNSTEVVAPHLTHLIRLAGVIDPAEAAPAGGRYVEHLRFEGLTFRHNQWLLPPGESGDAQGACRVPGAITLTGARHCTIPRCTLANLGTYAIDVGRGCRNVRVERCEMSDLGGGGVKISGGHPREPDHTRTSHVVVTDNHIHRIGQVYRAAIGVLLQHASDSTIAHNHIHHTYYTGISVGWVWGYGRTVNRANRVALNHIHHIGQGVLSDMGGVYLLGTSPETTVRNNVIHDVVSWGYGGWGIYTDEGSSHILIEDNIVYRTKSGGFHQHYGKENVIRNNVFAFAFGREGQVIRSREESHRSFTFEGNIVAWRTGPLLGKRWTNDQFRFDRNVYFNAAGQPVRFAGQSLEQWRKRGHDVHSVIADPLFVDAARGNFALKAGSPARQLGFRPIDTSRVGVRPH